MSDGVAASMKHALKTLGRRTPIVSRIFRQIDVLTADRDRIEAERVQAMHDLEEMKEARWKAVREREIAQAALRVATRQQAPVTASAPPPQTAPAETDDTSPIDPAAGKISILLCNYNHGAFIKQNIEAVLAQTYPNWELVVVDDGSTDGSQETIRSFAQRDQRIKPLFHPQNRGVMAAVDTGLAAMTGTLFYGSAADDHIASNRFFERAIRALARHPDATGVFGKARVVDAKSGEALWEMGSSPVQGFLAPTQALESFLAGGLFVPGASSIWRRADMDAVGGFDHRLGPQTDYFLNHALPALRGAVFIDEVFASVRASEGNYHRSGDKDDFFQRHGLVEGKLRSLDLPAPPDPAWLRAWRERLINSRLALTRQRGFFDMVRASLMDIEPWERAALSEGFLDSSQRILAEVEELEKKLDEQVASAHRTLDAAAGSIPDEDAAPQLPEKAASS